MKAILHRPLPEQDETGTYYWHSDLDPYDGQVVEVDVTHCDACGTNEFGSEALDLGFNREWLEFLPDDDPREPVI